MLPGALSCVMRVVAPSFTWRWGGETPFSDSCPGLVLLRDHKSSLLLRFSPVQLNSWLVGVTGGMRLSMNLPVAISESSRPKDIPFTAVYDKENNKILPFESLKQMEALNKGVKSGNSFSLFCLLLTPHVSFCARSTTFALSPLS